MYVTWQLDYCFQYAAREAQTVAQAGRKYAITISTNMTGRGTNIILGGNPKVGSIINIFLVDGVIFHLIIVALNPKLANVILL